MSLDNEISVKMGIRLLKEPKERVLLKVISLKNSIYLDLNLSDKDLGLEARELIDLGILRDDLDPKEVIEDYITSCEYLKSLILYDSNIEIGSFLDMSTEVEVSFDEEEGAEGLFVSLEVNLGEDEEEPESLPEVSENLTGLLMILNLSSSKSFTSKSIK